MKAILPRELVAALCVFATSPKASSTNAWFAPCAEAITSDGRALYIAGERSEQIAVVDTTARREIHRFSLPGIPTGMTIDSNGQLVVTTAGKQGRVLWLKAENGKVIKSLKGADGICSPVLLPEGNVVTCDRFENCVSLFSSHASNWQADAGREPVSAAASGDGTYLAVANFLPEGSADSPEVRATVRFLNPSSLTTKRTVWLPNGSTSVRSLAFQPHGHVCAVVHNVAQFQIPTTQVEFGWMNVAALSLVAPQEEIPIVTIILDQARSGAANPYCVQWSADGRFLCVSHSGTHELSVIDFPALQRKIAAIPKGIFVKNFSFLEGLRRRIPLPGNGPRAVAIHDTTAYVTEFFSDTIEVVDLPNGQVIATIDLSTSKAADVEREGERLFNDATLCHQGWQSCASCHPDGRVDGLNWDLLNDGIGNAKNTKSLLLAHRTPPSMSTGFRDSAEIAVRSGLRHILFAKVEEHKAEAIDEYLKRLKPVTSPYLTNGKLRPEAVKGKNLFENAQVGCATCHPAPLFTDLKRHLVSGTQVGIEKSIPMDTPTLVECWRTAPYLHDGSAATLRDVLTNKNLNGSHGKTSHLSPSQLRDLELYVLSL